MTHQRILLLQGKMGTFFSRFATFLIQEQKEVFKINFNYADEFFFRYKNKATAFTDTLSNFDTFLTDFIQKNTIDAIVCFNDCIPAHAIAKTVAQKTHTSFFVFEEGYLRPDYITLQEHGINGYSQLDISQIEQLDFANDTPLYTHNRFWRLCISSTLYYGLVFLNKNKYPHYRHYRGLSIGLEATSWLKAPFRKLKNYIPDKILQANLLNSNTPFFVVALQVHNDSQISHHSDYIDVENFILEILSSFAQFIQSTHKKYRIVFKHHPLDRGHRDYTSFIYHYAKQLNISELVFYGCDLHLPSLIKKSIGFVTINSTTALQAIYHKTPTKIMGRALYNLARLADQQPLEDFWHNPTPPDHDFYLKFREYLIEQTQLNGSFYGTSPWKISYRLHKQNHPAINQHNPSPPKSP